MDTLSRVKITDSVYFSKGEGDKSNSGFIVRSSDVILVDTADVLEKTRKDLEKF